MKENYLLKQYRKDKKMKVKHNYLSQQFYDYKKILKNFEKVIKRNEFTLGREVDQLEHAISKLLNSKYVVSVGSGTDALMLSLKAVGVKEGDEVITTPFTFYATIGAIVTSGAKPVFVDVKDDYNLDPDLIQNKITKKTKAIVPVHWAGRVCEMDKIIRLAKKNNIQIIEDSCQAILATYKNKLAGKFSSFGCFSMHPLKNLNIWGDGGFVICSNKRNYKKMRLMRNHGLIGRNKNLIFGYNSRLDTLQAVVGLNAIRKIKKITKRRIENSLYLDNKLKTIKNVICVKREKKIKEVFHLYKLNFKNKKVRDTVLNILRKKGIDAKIHYPTSMHLQPAAKRYGYKKGDFPIAEKLSQTSISLPVHEYVTKKQLNLMINLIKTAVN